MVARGVGYGRWYYSRGFEMRLTATNQESEPSRLVRLQAMKALIEYDDRKTFDHIEELHDHKGVLTVVYLRGYSRGIDKRMIAETWDYHFGEHMVEFKEGMFCATSLDWDESSWGF